MKFFVVLAFVALSCCFFTSASASKSWVLDESANNTNITPTVGDTILVQLKGNPTTGFKWILECLSGDVVSFGGRSYDKDSGHHGGGGVYKFPFNVVAPGHGSLFLKYARHWEGVSASTFLVSWKGSHPTNH